MSAAYHERFAAELKAALPEGFEVFADRSMVSAAFDRAVLVGYTPHPADKRAPVTRADAALWIEQALAALRRNIPHYTAEAQARARALFAALEVSV